MRTRLREGEYAKNLVPVLNHPTGVISQLKEIDNGYFVVLNTRTQRFEIHNSNNRGFYTYCLSFTSLDGRVIEEVKRTRYENAQKLIAEMDAYNEKLQMQKEEKYLDEIGWKAREYYQFLDNHPSAMSRLPQDAYKTRWV